MRKILLLTLLALLCAAVNNRVKAQCSQPCPQLFTLKDSIGCNSVEVRRSLSGYNNLPFEIRACKNSKMKYSLSTDTACFPVISYSLLSISGGTLVSLVNNSFVVQWGAAATGNIVFTFTLPAGAGMSPCDTITLNYTLFNSPVAAFTASPQPACFNNPTTISFNSSGTLNATNYFWDFGDSYTSVLPNPTHAYTSPGTYTVTLIVANVPLVNGVPVCPTCVDSIKKTVVIDNLPGPDITCVATVCAGETQTYCTSAAACSSYAWTVTGGVITSGQNTPCVTIQWGSGNPQGTINLVATGCTITYCPQGTTVTVPIIPATGTITGAQLVCVNTTELYNLPAWPGTTYNWTLSGGGVISPYNTNTSQISINWTSFGNHTITCNYFDTALNCGGSATYIVLVRPALSISGPTSFCVNSTNNFNATRPVGIPVPGNWVISPGTATINSGNGTPAINVTWPVAGTYTINATSVAPNIVCSPASYTVTVLPAPVLSSINGADSICPGQTYVYSATSNAAGLYNWFFTGAASFSFLGVNNDSVQVTWASSGSYSISVTQFSIPGNCSSNTLNKNIFPYPTPVITGPVMVCADNTETYTITNIVNGNFQWSVTPPSFGTILSGQGTPTVQIKWHGNNSPGSSNTVYLHYGVCNSDSIAITINEPPIPSITASGTLCAPGGVTLNTGATGIFSWTGPVGSLPGTPSITGLTIPGNYSVQIQNFNGTGCTVSANYTIPDSGRPNATISASNVLNYCLPNLPNLNLVAANAPGYTFQWYFNNTPVAGPAGINPILTVNTLTVAGTYTYYCVVTLGGCIDTSNILVITISNCPPPVGCVASITVTGITGCNPFTLTVAATGPPGATISGTGNPTITHLEDGYVVSGNTTRTYTSVGYKQVRICADVLLPDLSICRVCKDTVVHVTVAADFTSVVNCGLVNLYDASTTVFPAVISSYNWTVGTNPGNLPVPLLVASFNNNSIANPLLTVTVTGSYIVTQTITSGSCTVIHRDTFNISVPNAAFNVINSCVGTTVNFNNLFPATTNFWDFGDAATSYTSPTFHAYGAAGLYAITHIVTDANGCKDTVVKPISIVPAPVCTVTASGPLTFCFGDSVILGSSCAGLVNFQWYNNGVAIPGQTFSTDTVKQTGNYSFVAFDINGCKVISDTVTVTVNQAPNATIIASGSVCAGSVYTVSVPGCAGCTYLWFVDGNPVSTNSAYPGTAGVAPYTTGTHNITIQVINGLGCMNSSSMNVTFYALPTVSVNVIGPVPFCSNNIYTLNAVSSASSPAWAWTYNNTGFVLSTTNSLTASAAGNYTIKVTDGITGCTNNAVQTILPSPELNLFPIGCDTLCDTAHVFLPLQSFNGNLSGYNIDWYDNAPPYGLPVYNGISFPLNILPTGNHNLSVIVTSPNGCKDTSTVYSLVTKNCNLVLAIREIKLNVRQVGNIALLSWSTEQEIDNDYFIAERSFDGLNFTYAGKIWSKGNSFNRQYYSFNDPITTENQPVYYRIRIVDKRGHEEYSLIVKLNPVKQYTQTLSILPNRTKTEVMVVFQSNVSINGSMVVYSADGRQMEKQAIFIKEGLNAVPLNLSGLAAALYRVTVTTNEQQLTGSVLKQ